MAVSPLGGSTVEFSAEGTTDPDGDSVALRWFIYPEAGTMEPGAELGQKEGATTQISVPPGAAGTLHVVLHAQDNGTPPLSACRRTLITVEH